MIDGVGGHRTIDIRLRRDALRTGAYHLDRSGHRVVVEAEILVGTALAEGEGALLPHAFEGQVYIAGAVPWPSLNRREEHVGVQHRRTPSWVLRLWDDREWPFLASEERDRMRFTVPHVAPDNSRSLGHADAVGCELIDGDDAGAAPRHEAQHAALGLVSRGGRSNERDSQDADGRQKDACEHGQS